MGTAYPMGSATLSVTCIKRDYLNLKRLGVMAWLLGSASLFIPHAAQAASTKAKPTTPNLQVAGGFKALNFSWQPIAGIKSYRLFENKTGGSGYTQISGNLPANQTSFSMPISSYQMDWSQSRYLLEACNSSGCSSSQAVNPAAAMLSTIGYLKASNTGAGDNFGGNVALSADGSILAVAAPYEASANSNPADDSAAAAGAIYVFTHVGNSWLQQAYLKASNAEAGDNFGSSLALSANGKTLAVGASGEASASSAPNDNSAPGAGAVYIFTNSGNSWKQQAYVKATKIKSSSNFGVSVSLNAKGNLLVVGARGENSAATGINGNQDDNSAPGAGAAYIFALSGNSWVQQAYVKASNTQSHYWFGSDVVLSGNGSTLAVASSNESNPLGGINANQYGNNMPGAGAVYVFTRGSKGWMQQAYIKAATTDVHMIFGYSLAMSNDGNTLAVGSPQQRSYATGINGNQTNDKAPGSGAAYIFSRAQGAWNQQAFVKASNTDADDNFGHSVALSRDGNTLAVGATGEGSAAAGINGDQADNGAYSAGAAYVYSRSGSTWQQQAYVKASNPDAYDNFGSSVALSGDAKILAVGSQGEDSSATGIDGDQANDNAQDSGAVYLY